VLPLLGSDSPRRYDGTTAEVDEELQGRWTRHSVESNGHLLMVPGGVLLTVRGRAWEENTRGQLRTAAYTTDPSRNPRRLELVHPDDPPGIKRRYLYQIHGDTLKIASLWPNDAWPVSFKDFDDDVGLTVVTYKRAKK
jgi:uncharacterized protein (TIGR03067 family)